MSAQYRRTPSAEGSYAEDSISSGLWRSEATNSSEEAVPPPPPAPASKISSLDIERVVNEYSIQATRDRFLVSIPPDGDEKASPLPLSERTPLTGGRLSRHTAATAYRRRTKLATGRTATRWILSAIVGLCTGLTTIFIVEITGRIIQWRTQTLDVMAQSKRFPNSWVFAGFLGMNGILAVAASILSVYLAPEGVGSGIAEVKAYLNGVRVKQFSSWRLFGVKIVGTILSVSSSLAVGMEGPLIHIGAIVGASFTKLASLLASWLASTEHYSHLHSPTPGSTRQTQRQRSCWASWRQSLWTFATTNLAYFSIDAERRDFVAIGASVGFAASFGAPIGGLLFILDDISVSFPRNMFLRILVANAIGTFCLAVQSGNLSNYSIIDFITYEGAKPTSDIFLNRFEFVPLYIALAVVTGILGGLFCKSFIFMKTRVSDRLQSNVGRVLEVAALSVVTSCLTFGIPMMAWTCQTIPPDDIEAHLGGRGRTFFCDYGQVNEMATMMFGSRTDAIQRILSDPNQFQERTLWTVAFLFYGLMTLTYGSFIPSGIFTPTVLIGASLGGGFGLALQRGLTGIIPSTFALLGVAGMLAGIQRSTISVSVILVEGTGKIQVLLPVIIVVLVSRYVSGMIHPEGIYEVTMILKNYPYLEHEEKRRFDIFQVSQIMSAPPEVMGPLEKASHLVALLQKSPHNGFPVVHPRTKKFLGLVRRDQIIALLECGVFEEGDFSLGDNTSVSSLSDLCTLPTPRPGIGKSPLMHLAFHIKDDRFDHVSETSISAPVPEDGIDRFEWFDNVHKSLKRMPPEIALELDDHHVPTAGDDSLPPLRRMVNVAGAYYPQDKLRSKVKGWSRTEDSTTEEFVRVGVDHMGNLVVHWLRPECRNKLVNLHAVMNRGTFCVPEHMPVSNARALFTKLGLRHVVVLGGASGGEVVGIFTRANLMPSYIEARTGVSF